MGAALGSLAEVRELRREISGLRDDLKKYIGRANQHQAEIALGDMKGRYGRAFAAYHVEDARNVLSDRMIPECPMRERCYATFIDYLEATSQHIREGAISADLVRSFREQMAAMRTKGPFDRCDTCFSEVRRLFEKQIDLMRSLGIYQEVGDQTGDGPSVPDEAVAMEILEPVANSQRYRILASLMSDTRTFSELSRLTGLRGGNLTFHLRKLVDSGMLLQRHERGDYVISDRGYRTMTAIANLQQTLRPA